MFNRLLHNCAKTEVVLYGTNVQHENGKVLNIKFKIKIINVTQDLALRMDRHEVTCNCRHYTRHLHAHCDIHDNCWSSTLTRRQGMTLSLHLDYANNKTQQLNLTHKKAMLSQRWPRDAPYNLPSALKILGSPWVYTYIHTYIYAHS